MITKFNIVSKKCKKISKSKFNSRYMFNRFNNKVFNLKRTFKSYDLDLNSTVNTKEFKDNLKIINYKKDIRQFYSNKNINELEEILFKYKDYVIDKRTTIIIKNIIEEKINKQKEELEKVLIVKNNNKNKIKI